MVTQKLQKSFPNNPSKQKIEIASNCFRIACPYCGDSNKNNYKKRGQLYFEGLSFYCFNCGIYKKVDKFFSDFNSEDYWDILEYSKSTLKPKQNNFSITEEIKKLDGFSKLPLYSIFCKKLGLKDVSVVPYIRNYLINRLQRPSAKFAYDEKKKLLYIFNLVNDKILSFQIRNMNISAHNKYYTYTLEKIYSNYSDIFEEELKEEELVNFNRLSFLFGISEIDYNKKITIFEGPLDSFLLPNSIGICSVKNSSRVLNLDNIRFLFDKDEAGLKESIELIKRGFYVFMWDKFLSENKLYDFRIKNKVDFTDILVYCKKNNIQIRNFSQYFTNNDYDILYL